MADEYLPAADYQALYAKYLSPQRTAQLVSLAGDLNNKVVADLCCGNGRLSVEVLRTSPAAQLVLVDKSDGMVSEIKSTLPVVKSDIADFLQSRPAQSFNAVLCQQAINYWLTPETAKSLVRVVAPGGLLVFNTFENKPSPEPRVKEYTIAGKNFVEVDWLEGDMVRHLQIAPGLPVHETKFKWISPKQYEDWLGDDFEIEKVVDGGTAVYRCTRKTTEFGAGS